MGGGASVTPAEKAAVEVNNRINAELELHQVQMHKEQVKTINILLLGPSEVGKSTILKQMKILHCKGFSEKEQSIYKWTILKETVKALVALTKAFLDSGQSSSSADQSACLNILTHELERIDKTPHDHVAPESSMAVKSLLTSAPLKSFLNVYKHLNEEAIYSSYFVEHAERITSTFYAPIDDDFLKLRIQTTGINEITFQSGYLTYRVFDVGGQKSLRRKWLHVFDNAKSIMFLCALSDYNLVMKEDFTTPRMEDALQLCVGIFGSQWFTKAALILFFNKKNVFEEKLKAFPVISYFPDYKGDNTFHSAATYFEHKFTSACQDGQREIFVHRTCATDTDQMKLVIGSCIAKIASDNMRNTGLG